MLSDFDWLLHPGKSDQTADWPCKQAPSGCRRLQLGRTRHQHAPRKGRAQRVHQRLCVHTNNTAHGTQHFNDHFAHTETSHSYLSAQENQPQRKLDPCWYSVSKVCTPSTPTCTHLCARALSSDRSQAASPSSPPPPRYPAAFPLLDPFPACFLSVSQLIALGK